MEPQARRRSQRALRRPWRIRRKRIPDRLSSLGNALEALAAKMEPQARRRSQRALRRPWRIRRKRIPTVFRALAMLWRRWRLEWNRRLQRRSRNEVPSALRRPWRIRRKRIPTVFRALVKPWQRSAQLLPSAHHTHLLALSNLLLAPVPKKADEGEERSYDRKLFTAVCAQLSPQDLAEVLKYPFCTGEAEQIVLNQLEAKTQRNFGGDVWKFVEQADSLGIKDIGSPAKRPSVQDALNELNKL